MISKGSLYTVLNSFAQLVKAISTLVINKVVVIYLGPSALLFVGNLKSVLSILQQISGAGIYEGAKVFNRRVDRPTIILQASLSPCLLAFSFPSLFISPFLISYALTI